jgi:hypothetical protein
MNGGRVNNGVWIAVPLGLAAAVLLPACTQHKIEADTKHRIDVQPIEVKPIHLTVDVNIRVDRQLDDFFKFEEMLEPGTTRPATAPSPPPATVPAPEPVVEPVEPVDPVEPPVEPAPDGAAAE